MNLWKRFNQLDLDKNGEIDIDEIMEIEGMKNNAFSTRIIDMILGCARNEQEYDEKILPFEQDKRDKGMTCTLVERSGTGVSIQKDHSMSESGPFINFFQFCMFLSNFEHVPGDFENDFESGRQKKKKILFRMYDWDNTGYITVQNILDILKLYVLNDEIIKSFRDHAVDEGTKNEKATAGDYKSLVYTGLFESLDSVVQKQKELKAQKRERSLSTVSITPLTNEDVYECAFKRDMEKCKKIADEVYKCAMEGAEEMGKTRLDFEIFCRNLVKVDIGEMMHLRTRGTYNLFRDDDVS